MSKTGKISEYRSGVDRVFEWRISDFFCKLDKEHRFGLGSRKFSYGGERWRLVISPNESDSSEHLDLYLYKHFPDWSIGSSFRQSFSLSLKTAKGKKFNEQYVTKDFDSRVSDHHEFYRFIQTFELKKRRYELVTLGALTVVCTMRDSRSAGNKSNSSSADSASDSDSAECLHKCSNILDIVKKQMKLLQELENAKKRSEEGETSNAEVNKPGVAEASGSSQAGTTLSKESGNSGSADYYASDPDSDSAERSPDSDSGECCHKCSNILDIVKKRKTLLEELENAKKRSEEGETSNAEVNKPDVAEASGSSQAGTTLSKESVLKWIKENCKEASKEKRRKMEGENVLKWIEENCREASKGKKRKRVEENNDGSISQDFKKLLLEGFNHDLILKVGDKDLRAHQDVLRARSQVFKSMLDHDMKEKNSGIIDIPDCDPQAMEQFLFYIYSGNIETLDQSNMFNMYYIADKYEMKGLKKIINDFIRESLSQTNICDVIQLALNHSDSSLLESTTVYFRNNMLGIMRTVEWQKFLKDNSTVANELLIKAVEKLSNVKS